MHQSINQIEQSIDRQQHSIVLSQVNVDRLLKYAVIAFSAARYHHIIHQSEASYNMQFIHW